MKINAISALATAPDLDVKTPAESVYTFVALIAVMIQKIPTIRPVETRS